MSPGAAAVDERGEQLTPGGGLPLFESSSHSTSILSPSNEASREGRGPSAEAADLESAEREASAPQRLTPKKLWWKYNSTSGSSGESGRPGRRYQRGLLSRTTAETPGLAGIRTRANITFSTEELFVSGLLQQGFKLALIWDLSAERKSTQRIDLL